MVHPPVSQSLAKPMTADPDYEQRVRERAYQLWEAEGKPHGRDVEFWERARSLVAAEATAAAEAPPAAKPKAPRKQAAPAAGAQAAGSPPEPAGAKPDAAPKRKSPAKPKKPA